MRNAFRFVSVILLLGVTVVEAQETPALDTLENDALVAIQSEDYLLNDTSTMRSGLFQGTFPRVSFPAGQIVGRSILFPSSPRERALAAQLQKNRRAFALQNARMRIAHQQSCEALAVIEKRLAEARLEEPALLQQQAALQARIDLLESLRPILAIRTSAEQEVPPNVSETTQTQDSRDN